MNRDNLLDQIQKALDESRCHADVYDDGENAYVECTKTIEPVKRVLQSLGIRTGSEYESSGSDYDSYIIELSLQ